ncbi:MAG TPA: hypothetical protein VF060_29475 [Trebonia sp.]
MSGETERQRLPHRAGHAAADDRLRAAAAKSGHFAAWEEPELSATEILAAFKPLR